ncbi:TetR/AcrR family transcriptional regulator [Azospirillum picis]|uniref:AcrR family transcriptional regulator n=1 Tax=Azospirillum picis TaxID=488438 RepID=A0ABU0MGB4_9PROT|nr:TetR/AcrR family transcriptional regulator [Azospirillum picis]MBP2298468.1 AcrR family transcriptional regulator [Azospirillum picis]MDQ0532483.1 AcrR family transcriptional regulator [Azospirillum picis]
MINAYERKKQPAVVRRSLLDHGAQLCMLHGVASLTLQAVAEAAGVTKGGLLHHFRSKQELVEAIFEDLLASFDAGLEEAMAGDPEPHGRFTRAYIHETLDLIDDGRFSPWAALTMAMLADAGLRHRWADWLQQRLERHRITDGAPSLQIVRYAADGLWLASLIGEVEADPAKRSALFHQLIAMTKDSAP